MGKIVIKFGDITKETVDAVVNAANEGLRGGGGVDGAIHRAAGPSLMRECRKIGECRTGDAVLTGAGDLRAAMVIHAVGPVWKGGASGEPELLRSAYERSFSIARQAGARTIAFPAISAGAYGYPIEEAAAIALDESMKFKDSFDEIHLICFSERDTKVYQDIFSAINKDLSR